MQGSTNTVVSITGTSGGNFEAITTTSTATTAVTDDPDATTVSLTGAGRTVTEGGNASYTLTLSSPSVTAVTVSINYGGTAAAGSDYTGVATVTIPAGASSATFSIPTAADAPRRAQRNPAWPSARSPAPVASRPSPRTAQTTP